MWNGKEPLTDAEKQLFYADFYDMETPEPPKEVLDAFDHPIDPKYALDPKNMNDLLNPGYLEKESGWCIRDDGTAYLANYVFMPEVTPEMFHWWFAWHGLEDMRYRIWCPDSHFGIYVDEEARKKIQDPAVPMEQKYQGVTHYVIEDCGDGCNELKINFITPEEMGFDMDRFHEPNVSLVVGSNVQIYDPGKSMAPPIGVCMMNHFVRRKDSGIELRTHFWYGHQYIDKKPVKLFPDGLRMPDGVPKGLAVHSSREFTRLSYLLPELYKKYGDLPF